MLKVAAFFDKTVSSAGYKLPTTTLHICTDPLNIQKTASKDSNPPAERSEFRVFWRDNSLLRNRLPSPAKKHAEQHNNYWQADKASKKTGNQELICNCPVPFFALDNYWRCCNGRNSTL